MKLIDPEALKKSILQALCISDECLLTPQEKFIFKLIDEAPDVSSQSTGAGE